MHTIERYYKLNRILLETMGLWPYHYTYVTQLQRTLFITVLITFIIVQLLAFFTNQYTTHLLLQILSFVFPIFINTVQYCLFIVQTDNLKQLLEQIQDDWNSLKDKLEINILDRYACNARFCTKLLIVYCCFGLLFCGLFQLLPIILDVIAPLNESRPCELIVVTEYFVNKKKYFYITLLHETLGYLVGAAIFCSTSAIVMICILHACALFEIASCRIENAIPKSTLMIPTSKREYFLYRKIVYAVIMHQRAIKFVKLMTTSFATLFLILIILGISSLSFNLFQFLQLITLRKNSSQTSTVGILILLHLNYMFITNYGGQELLNHGLKLFKVTYNGLWYIAPLRTQKLLLFIMQKGTINIGLTCGSIFVASLEGFATLANVTVSYFTLIYSMR
ncbi:uncharacterized protein LOC105197961 isoform X2 [Solenopsis invicta]|uniref:uncharacterized protein LOC105197961 isoform X2 n=1 Tax=Solenopsis invicta TaxID=13686 RepID=UPI00193D55D2|nr:uncharacterized protein LOC105197961 isoform X2 [Solenopsis invicta]